MPPSRTDFPAIGAGIALMLGLVAASLSLQGCVTAPPKLNISSTFDAAEAQALLSDGTNTVRGSALIQQRGGGVVSCAGRHVALVPATAYAVERIGALYGSVHRGYNPAWGGRRFAVDGEPPEYRQLQRKTISVLTFHNR